MAKKSKIARDQQRRLVVERHAEERRELKRTIASPTADAGQGHVRRLRGRVADRCGVRQRR